MPEFETLDQQERVDENGGFLRVERTRVTDEDGEEREFLGISKGFYPTDDEGNLREEDQVVQNNVTLTEVEDVDTVLNGIADLSDDIDF